MDDQLVRRSLHVPAQRTPPSADVSWERRLARARAARSAAATHPVGPVPVTAPVTAGDVLLAMLRGVVVALLLVLTLAVTAGLLVS